MLSGYTQKDFATIQPPLLALNNSSNHFSFRCLVNWDNATDDGYTALTTPPMCGTVLGGDRIQWDILLDIAQLLAKWNGIIAQDSLTMLILQYLRGCVQPEE
jgi:hypothetical protein